MFKKLIRLFKLIWFYLLNANNGLASLWISISFQITIRIIKVMIILPFVNGVQLITSCVMTGATSDWHSRLHEYNPFNHQLKSLQFKYKLLSKTLYPKKFDKIKHRISRKILSLLGQVKKYEN